MFKKKKLLLIGKYSFVSSNLFSFLKNKLIVKKISFEDFNKLNDKKISSFNYICNCAISKKYLSQKYKSSNDFDYLITKKIKKFSSKFIFLSSRKIYSSKANLKENDTLKPQDIYSQNKLITEKKIKQYLKNRYIILRISNLIGRPLNNNKKRKVSKTFIDNFFKFKTKETIFYENHFKDFLSINQFTKIFNQILKKNPCGTYNVSLGKKVYIKEILDALNNKNSFKFKKIKIQRPDNFYLNNTKLRKLIKINITKSELINYCYKI